MSKPYCRKIVPKIIEMFKARQYKNWIVQEKEGEPIVITSETKKGNLVKCFLIDKPKFTVKTAEFCLKETGWKHLIILYRNTITCFAKRVLEMAGKTKVEHMACKEIEINIIGHKFQPKKFRRLENDEKEVFVQKWGNNFPKMLQSDAIARYFNFVQGDVIEIHRKDGDIVYRIVS